MSYNLGSAEGTIKITADTSGVDQAARKTDDALNKVSNSSKNTRKNLDEVGSASGKAAAVLTAGFALAVSTAANFEQGLSNIKAVSGATDAEMQKISDTALRIGKDTAFSASEAALAMEELVKAGISVDDVLNGAADATVNLAAAGGVDLPTAATIASNAMNQFGLTAEDMVGVVDNIAGAANASAIDVNEFGMSLSQVGAVANLAGLSFEDTAIAIAQMGNAGIKGSDAGTSLKTMLMNLQPQTKKQIDLFTELGILTEDGSNKFYDQEGKLKSLRDIQDILSTSMAGMTDAQKQAALEIMFGSDAIRAAAILTEEGAAGYDKMSEAMGKVSAADVAKTRMDNLKGSLEGLKGSLETVAIQVGMILIPHLRRFVDWLGRLIDWFGSLSPAVQNAVVVFGLVSTAVLAGVWVFSKIVSAVEMARKAFQLLGVALNLLKANPIVLAISLIVGALILLYNNSETVRKVVAAAWDAIKSGAQAMWGVVGPIINWFKDAWTSLTEAFSADGWSGVWDLIAEGFSNLWDTIGDFGAKLGEWIQAGLAYVAENLPGWFGSALSWLAGLPSWILGQIGDLGSLLGGWFSSAALYLGENIPIWIGAAFVWLFTQAVPWIAGQLGDLGAALADWFFRAVVYVGSNLPGWIWSAIVWVFTQLIPWIVGVLGDLAGALWQWIWAAISTVGAFVLGLAGTVGTWFLNFVSWAANGLGDLAGAIWDWIWGAISWVGGQIGSLAGEVGSWLMGLPEWVISGLGNLGQVIWDAIKGAFEWVGEQVQNAIDDIFSTDTENGVPDVLDDAPGGGYTPDWAEDGPSGMVDFKGGNSKITPYLKQMENEANVHSQTQQQTFSDMWTSVNGATTAGAQTMAQTTASGNASAQSSTAVAWSNILSTVGSGALQSSAATSQAWMAIANNTSSGNNSARNSTSSAWQSIAGIVGSGSSSSRAAASNAWSSIFSWVSGANNQTQGSTSNTWQSIASIISSRSAGARNSGVGNMTNMVYSIQSLGGMMMAAGAFLMASLAAGLASRAGTAINVMSRVGNSIVATAYSINLYSAGYNIMIGLAYGISAAGGAAIARARAIVNAINATIASAARIASPSKITLYYGSMIGQGLADGLEDRLQAVASVAEQGMERVLGVLNSDAAQLALSRSATEQPSLLLPSDFMARVASTPSQPEMGSRLNIEKIEINNPKSEPASNSLAVGIRKAAYVWSEEAQS